MWVGWHYINESNDDRNLFEMSKANIFKMTNFGLFVTLNSKNLKIKTEIDRVKNFWE